MREHLPALIPGETSRESSHLTRAIVLEVLPVSTTVSVSLDVSAFAELLEVAHAGAVHEMHTAQAKLIFGDSDALNAICRASRRLAMVSGLAVSSLAQ